MKTGIKEAVRRFIKQNIVADEPIPERSWLDHQDMPCLPKPSTAVVARPVEPLAPPPGPYAAHGRYPQRLWRSHPVTRSGPAN